MGEFRSASVDLDEAIRLDLKHAQTHNNRAYIALHLGQPQQAIDFLNIAIALESITQDFTAYRLWGLAHDDWEKYHRPREDFDEAILIVPWIGGVYAVRGVANAMLVRDSASRLDIKRAEDKELERTLVERAIRMERSKLAR